jgi:hypothetical protein
MNVSTFSPPKLSLLTIIGVSAICLSACGPSEPITEGPPPDVRRLTEDQYKNIISDVFGASIIVGGRFDTPVRTEGLQAVGARNATVTAAALSQYDEMARSISEQVMSEPSRQFLVPCAMPGQVAFDESCTTQFISKTGRLLFRRPLTDDETSARTDVVRETTQRLGSFKEGLSSGLASLLVSPQFLFIADVVEDDPDSPGAARLNAFSKATRLSFFLWNRSPDNTLLQAAETGDLHSEDGLEGQVERMMASPLLKAGVRSFFSDLLEFSEFDFLEKDSLIYPAFGAGAVRDAQEQTLRTITDHVVTKDKDYRDLFTTRDTFMTSTLGMVYRVQVKARPGTWEPYQFAPDDPRIGIQGHLSFLALNSHPGRSSPTLRGKAIRNMLLCQQVPDPPPDVDFSGFNDPNSPSKTAKERLTAHSTSPACAGCHRITDPIGLALEKFDGAGQFRQTENGAPIDTSGDLDGIDYADSKGLGLALRDNPATTKCLINRLYAYGSGNSMSSRSEWMTYLEDRFTADGYRITSLMKRISTSNTFYAVSAPDMSGETIETAANNAAID